MADKRRYAGLERTDNGMKMTTWPEVAAINQKNYYTCATQPHLSRSSEHLKLTVSTSQ